MAAFMLDDPHGTVEVVVFPEAFSKAASLLQTDALVLVKGRFERDEDSTRLLASEILPIETGAGAAGPRGDRARCDAARHDRRTVRGGVGRAGPAQGRPAGVVRRDDVPDATPPLRVRVDVSGQVRVRPSEQLVADLERICGPGTVTLR